MPWMPGTAGLGSGFLRVRRFFLGMEQKITG
jgi:hypothetical protein